MTAAEQFQVLLRAQRAEIDEKLEALLLERAGDDIAGICNTPKAPRETESAMAELALIYYNRIGAEGEQRRTEGDLSYAFYEGIPQNIVSRLLKFRKGRVV